MWVSKKKWSELENTLQSIESTLKRIEIILLDFQKSQKNRNPLKAAQDGVEVAISRMKPNLSGLHLKSQDR